MSHRSLAPAFQRLISVRRRPSFPLTRSLSTSTPLLNTAESSQRLPAARPRKSSLAPELIPPPTALSALLARLNIPADQDFHPDLITCLTHPSFNDPRGQADKDEPPLQDNEPTNELFCAIGNSLLGLFAAEHLAAQYPLLPTEALKLAVTAYVGHKACFSVARELGVGVQSAGNSGAVGRGRGLQSAGIPVRWRRTQRYEDEGGPERIAFGRRFRRHMEGQARLEEIEEQGARSKRVEGFEEVVAATVRAFVGLIYQEMGIHAARTFVHAHFFTRHLDLPSLFNFKNPKYLLSGVVAKQLVEAGVSPNSGLGRIEARLLASTGAHSASPIFNVGLFLPTGLKLAEGHGSSLKMAEHRAAVNALLSVFLVRGDQGHRIGTIPDRPKAKAGDIYGDGLPTRAHVDFPMDLDGVASGTSESEISEYHGSSWGGGEVEIESSKRRAWEGRVGGKGRAASATRGDPVVSTPDDHSQVII
ncbi:ribonuclease III domain-containing protein [Naematelia encephala]|uniref:Large ribosomal subunit protein mL44 n=1 Tax=Naematelia encephala TaxID=71784 RepID=A0A1Y2B2E3_9TREE|nr:ribonuclease III domain-containing protein [Naematelia encephala]